MKDLRTWSAADLGTLFDSLHATQLPSGDFVGDAWSHDVRGIGLMNRLWQGKQFRGEWVTNTLFGLQRVTGHVTLAGGSVVIRYPRYGLVDLLRPLERDYWLGQMALRGGTVWFTLEQE